MCLIGTENICVTGGIARIFKKRGGRGGGGRSFRRRERPENKVTGLFLLHVFANLRICVLLTFK